MPEQTSTGAGSPMQRELQRVNRALHTLSSVNRALHRASDEQALLHDVCRAVVEQSGYRLAWVSYKEYDENKTIRPVAFWGFEDGWLSTLNITWADSERGRGPTGTVVRTGERRVVNDVMTDPSCAPWREEALKRGYASGVALPLMVEGEVLGAITIAASEPDAFHEKEIELLATAAQDLGFGIEALRTKAKRRQAEETVQRMVYHDALTGLPNRVKLRESLNEAIGPAKAGHRPLALLLMEIDRFREINETIGYAQGDVFLQQTAARIPKVLEAQELVARVGEAEFAVLLPQGDAAYAGRVAKRILDALEQPVQLDGLMLDVRANIGIALFPGHGADADTLLRRANVAMHQAKRARTGYAVYSGGLDSERTRRMALVGDLHRAIQNNELLLYCQAKVDLRTRQVCGAEALVRWQHPEHGMVSPSEFILLAEQAGLISPVTDWVLEAAFRQTYAWRDAGLAVPLAVNLSARDLQDAKVLDKIQGLFATWGNQPDWLQFELTESALMDDPAGTLQILKRLKDIGPELFIDDFGTGYSSLSYLQKLPVDAIKIDQSFVRDMLVNKDAGVIVRSTIDLGHNLDLKVVAEGVENEDFWNELAAQGCDVAQGYVISRPMPVSEFHGWHAQSQWRAKG